MNFGYVRVSTKGQMEGNSVEEQTEAIRNKYPDADIYVETGSGSKNRPILNGLMKKCSAGDRLIVTKLDRFCRTTKEGLEYIEQLKANGVDIHILNMGLIEDTAMGKLIVTNLLAFAEFERAMIIERTHSGKAIARQNPGFREGRPKKYTPEQIEHALDLLNTNSYRQVERMTGISVSTLTRAKRRRTNT